MDKAQVDRWLEAYVTAWKAYDRDLIGALFAEDVVYRYHPYDEPVTGRAAVVGAWLGEEEHQGASTVDAPGTFDAVYRTVAVDGDVAVATGCSTYLTELGDSIEQVFDNCFVLHFDQDGRCREYTEWYMRRPSPGGVPPAPEQA